MLILVSCEDVVEENLSGESVSILSPPSGFTSTSGSVEFNWQDLEGALGYRIQVAYPSFDSLVNMRLDTLVSSSAFTYPFSPGSYEWCIRAENGSSVSDWTCSEFSVDSIMDLSGVQVPLVAPQQGAIFNKDSVLFTWQTVNGATDYRFTLFEESIQGPLVYGPVIVSETQIQIPVDEGVHAWSVQGIGMNSNSETSLRSFTDDKTAPIPAVLFYPSNGVTLPSDTTVVFEWEASSDQLTEVTDSLFLVEVGSTDTLGVFLNSTFSLSTDSILPGAYQWQIRSRDEASNYAGSTSAFFNVE